LGSPNFEIISNLVINNATFFPNIGAYPNGQSSENVINQYTTNNNNDSNAEKKANIAFIVGVAGIFLWIILSVVVVYLFIVMKNHNQSSSSSSREMSSPVVSDSEITESVALKEPLI
jgi:beta-lactamase regulating signal transducer with metallopeptidase domain